MKMTISLEDLLGGVDTADLFDRPLGPSPSCVSTSQVVRMFEIGARPEELHHVLGCSACNEIVSRSNQLGHMMDVGMSPTQSEGFGAAIREKFLGAKPGRSAPDISAVLGLMAPVLEISDPNVAVSMTIELFPCVGSTMEALDVSTLRLDGAAISEIATLDTNASPGQLPRVTFHGAKLSRAVKRTLSYHNRVADQISVSGMLKGQSDKLFLGKAQVEIVQS